MNSQPEKHHKSGVHYVRWGLTLIAISVGCFLLGLLYLKLIYIPAHQGSSEDLPAILALSNPLMIELLVFMVGTILAMIGRFKRCSPK